MSLSLDGSAAHSVACNNESARRPSGPHRDPSQTGVANHSRTKRLQSFVTILMLKVHGGAGSQIPGLYGHYCSIFWLQQQVLAERRRVSVLKSLYSQSKVDDFSQFNLSNPSPKSSIMRRLSREFAAALEIRRVNPSEWQLDSGGGICTHSGVLYLILYEQSHRVQDPQTYRYSREAASNTGDTTIRSLSGSF